MVHTQNSHTVEITLKLKKQNSLEKVNILICLIYSFFNGVIHNMG